MPVYPSFLSSSCGTGLSANVPRSLRDLFFPVRVRPPCTVRNRPPLAVAGEGFPACPPRHGASPLLDGLAEEAIDWGTAILVQRAAHCAGQMVPGISHLHAAWRICGSLSAACRGRFLHALQAVPLDTVLPAAVLLPLRQLLEQLRPDCLSGLPDQDDIVLGVGLCALLYSLAWPEVTPAALPAQTIQRLAWLQRLRVALNIMRSLRPLHHGDLVLAGAGRDHGGAIEASAGSVSVAAPVANRTLGPYQMGALEGAFPLAAAGRQIQSGCLPQSQATAWPLPGAGADKAKPVPATKIAHRIAVSARKVGFHIKQVKSRIGTRHRHRHRHGHRQGAGHANADPAKERLLSPLEHPDGAGTGRQKSHGRDRRPADKPGNKPAPPVLAPRDQANITTALLPVVPPQPSHAAPANQSIPFTPSDVILPPPIPSCLVFHDQGQAWKQMDAMRFESLPARFCVHSAAADTFELVFARPHISRGIRQECSVSIALLESSTAPLHTAMIHRRDGLGHRDEELGPTALGDDAIYAVATVSRLDPHRMERFPINGTRLLPWNSFKILRHVELGGGERLLLAYAINPPGRPHEMRMGLLEIQQDERGYSVTDEPTGYVFTGDTLKELATGLQQVSRCDFHVDALEPAVRIDTLQELQPLQHTPHLFVHEGRSVRPDAATDADPPSPRFNPSLSFFAPVPFHFHDGLVSGVLYRGCFTHVGGSLIFVDNLGGLGTLHFSSTDPHREVYVLERQQGPGKTFIDDHGLLEDTPYTMCEVVELLQRQGLVRVAYGYGETGGTACSGSGTNADADGVADGPPDTTAREKATPWPVAGPPRPEPRRSTYVFDNRQMLYVDPGGSQGVLNFVKAGPDGSRRALADDNTYEAIAFAGFCGLIRGRHYTLAEILQYLAAAGMVADPKLSRTFDYQAQRDSRGPTEWGLLPRE